jgi:hypothetical protein
MAPLARRLLSTTGVVGAAAATMLYVTSPASAAVSSYDVDTASSGDYLYQAGTEWFYPSDDSFNICDNWSDGAGVIGYWKVGSSGTVHSKYDGNGFGECVTSDQDFAESATIYIKVCLRDDGTVVSGTCSSWEKAYADGVP